MPKQSTVRSRNIGRDVLAGLKNIIGGEIEEYTKLQANSREQALQRLIEDAEQFDADISFGALHSLGNLKIRLRSEHQSLLPKINTAIKELKNSGRLDAIINKYTKSIPLQ